MISSTNTIGSLEAALAMASYNLYAALAANDKKAANSSMGMIGQIIGQIKNVRKLIELENDKAS